jgi:hypothetical protein
MWGILSLYLSLYSNFCGFGTIIWGCRLLEPRMLKCLFGGNSFSGIVDEDLLKKVQEVSAEFVVVRYDFLVIFSTCNYIWRLNRLTSNRFIALTNRLEALVVSG